MPQNIGKETKSSLRHKYLEEKDMGERSLREALFDVLLRGSMTLEAALALPIFLYAVAVLLSLFLMMQTEYVVGNALDRAVADTALLGELSEEKGKNLMKAAFYKELAQQRCPLSLIVGKTAGFSWKHTMVDRAYIDAVVTYQLKAPISFFGKHTMKISEGCQVRRWTGEQGEGQESGREEWVFITPNQSVYHMSRDCTHLKLSVTSLWVSGQQDIENTYSPCRHCTRGQKMGTVIYVTAEGGCYHFRINCSGLKRTVYMVKKTQAGDKRPCSRCG